VKLCVTFPLLIAAMPTLFGQVATDGRPADGSKDYIVVFKDKTARHVPDRLQHLRQRATYHNLPAMAVRLNPGELNQLGGHPDVDYIAPDRPVRAASNVLAETINADHVWANFNKFGNGIGVAVIDSGINNQAQDFGDAAGKMSGSSSRIVYAENFLVPLGANGQYPNTRYKTTDDYGHGTHVAGIIAGNGFVSNQLGSIRSLTGIAPQATLIDLKVLDGTGQGNDSNVIAAIDRAISLQKTYKIGVINLSIGRRVYSSFTQDPLCLAVERAWQAGIVVVVAAGNDGRNNDYGTGGYGTINAPGNDPMVITVGAMRTAGTSQRNDDEIATYSSRGPTPVDHIVKPDLVAPGNLVDSVLAGGHDQTLSYLPTKDPQNIVDNLTIFTTAAISNYNGDPTHLPSYFVQPSYLTLSGTSMAAAVTSGAVALLLSSEHNLTPDQVKARLMLTATKNFTSFGAGYFSYVTKAQQTQQKINDLNTLTMPVLQKAAQQAQSGLDQATNQLQKAQQAQAQAAAAVPPAQAAVAQAQAAYDAAQQNLAAAQALAQQLWATANAADTTLLNDSTAASTAKQGSTDPHNSPAQQAAYLAQYNQLTAQVAADTTAYNNAVAAAKNQDNVVKQANPENASHALSNAQSTLQKAQSTLAQANSSLASSQSTYATASVPGNNLAAEQALIVTLQQQLAQYQALAGTSTNVALAQAQQLTQQANTETQYVLPGLQTAAAQAQHGLDQATSQLQQAQAAQAAAVAAVPAAQAAVVTAQSAYDAAQLTLTSAQALDAQLWTVANTAQTTLFNDTNAANTAKQQSTDPHNNASQQAKYLDQYNQLTIQVAADTTAYNNALAAAKTQDSAVQSATTAARQAQDAFSGANGAQHALQQAQSNLDNANTTLAKAQSTYNSAMGPANALAAEQAKIANLLQQAAQYNNQANSTPQAVQYDIFTVGAGYLDIQAAMGNNAKSPDGAGATSPVAYFDSSSGTFTMTGNYMSLCAQGPYASVALWGTTICGNVALWGTNTLWGNVALWGTNSLWGNVALWGTNSMWGNVALWGTNVFVNGTVALWGTNTVWASSGTEAFVALWGTQSIWAANAPYGTNADFAASSMVVLIDGDIDH